MGKNRSGRPVHFARAAFAAALLLVGGAGPSGAADVVSATAVCAADANPCKVTGVVAVADGAVLDFGTRAVQLSGAGQFNFGAGSGSILCGPFSAATAGAAINAKGSVLGGGTESGSVTIEARRLCSAGAAAMPCVGNEECRLGACSVRRCSGKTTRTCTSEASCSIGPCGGNKRCAGAVGIVRCETNADCDFGTCPPQFTCANKSAHPLNCSSDADCDLGSCSVGTASISMGGAIVGNSGLPAVVTLRAADSVSILKTVNLASSATESDGGELSIEAVAGSVTVTAKITATGGSAAQGGSVDLTAGGDAVVAEEIGVAGGDFDGGSVLLEAGRDVSLGRSILANSMFGAGYGGEVIVTAGRDLLVSGASTSSPAALEASGHTDTTDGAGDGGTLDFTAGRNVTLSANSRLTGRGSDPDGSGAQVFVDAGAAVTLAGKVDAGTNGDEGGGGSFEVISGGAATVAATAIFDVSGGAAGGGRFTSASGGALGFSGSVNAAGTAGPAGFAKMVSAADALVGGKITTAGLTGEEGDAGTLALEACRVTLASGAVVDNKAASGENRITTHESTKLLAGSAMTAGSGTNVLVYRTAEKPPLLQGTVTPTALKFVDGTLTGCPVCGNLEIDAGETCDDGNTGGGDGCSADCQNENCIAETDGYPAVPLCDDGKPCTEDFCSTALARGTCRHRTKDCDDGIACTIDSCLAGGCSNRPVDAACDDANPCTDDFCSTSTGCSLVNNSEACDDADNCTRADQCTGGACRGTPSNGCGDCGDGVIEPPELCDDGNSTFTNGEDCGVDCAKIPCGKPTNSSGELPKSRDALFALRAAVRLVNCSLRVCDADGSGAVAATDALRILRAAVGVSVPLKCPA